MAIGAIPASPLSKDPLSFSVRSWGIAEWMFAAYLYISFVGLVPFASRELLLADHFDAADPFKQIAFSLVSLGIIASTPLEKLRSLMRLADPWLVLAFSWAFLSISWSIDPATSFRRFALTGMSVAAVIASVSKLGIRKSLEVLYTVLLVLVGLSLLLTPFIANGRHLGNEAEPGLVGSWRGIFFHKNIAGLASSILTLLAFWSLTRAYRPATFAVVGLGITFLILSASKTSAILLIPSIAAGWTIARLAGRPSGRFANVAVLIVALFATVWCALSTTALMTYAANHPDAFTGRADLWSVLIEMIKAHPFIGYGFGGIYGLNEESPLLLYAKGWFQFAAHGHNGYLDLIASTGLVGFALSVTAFLIRPLTAFMLTTSRDRDWTALLAGILVFIAFHNMLETSLMDRAAPGWIVLLLCLAATRQTSDKTP